MKVTVESCTRRRDDKFLVGFYLPGTKTIGSAISDAPVAIRSDVIVRDGRVETYFNYKDQ